MKRYLLLLTFFMAALGCIAVPAQHRVRHIVQPDGTTLSVWLQGDEHMHFFITADSIPVFETAHGFCYGYVEGGMLHVSDVVAHEKGERKSCEAVFARDRNALVRCLADMRRRRIAGANSQLAARSPRKEIGVPKQYLGSKKGLVILVNFANLSMSNKNTQTQFNALFNEEGYSQNGSIGSVHDYFYDQSYGKFSLTFDVVGPVTLKHDYAYYGTNDVLTGNDTNARDMVIEACQAVDGKVNFADYDWDGDGEVDQVYIIYAGYGEHAGAPSNTIWPHRSLLGSRAVTLGGVRINQYACSCELVGTEGDTITGIGTPCHEFSHCLGLPDLYDTDYSGAFGMSYWDLMNSGSHSGPTGNGEVPYGYSAYERWFAGWLEPVEVSATRHISGMADVGSTPEAYVVYNEGSRNEFYMIENHQPSRWFTYVGRYIGMGGIMVTHVNYDEWAWTNNRVNPNPDYQYMSIIPADNSYGNTEDELRGDLFPGSKGIALLSNTSHAKAGGTMYNRNTDGTYALNRTLNRMRDNGDGTMSLDVVFNEEIPTPLCMKPADVNAVGYTARWMATINADSYTVEQRSVGIGADMRPVFRTQTVEDVLDTSLPLQWLTVSGYANYRVKAVVGEFESDWSDITTVERPADGISGIKPDGDCGRAYGINGIERTCALKGINIIRCGGKAVKVLVK